MVISINWSTGVIFVPKADLPLIQASPEIRGLDINSFRLELKNLEDSDGGMGFTKTHDHNTEVSLSGIVYARIVKVIAPYTVKFEDGQYTVSITGGNHNLADVKVPNQVSILVNNAAGLISNAAIEHASFQDEVTLDVVNGFSGTIYPVGTPFMPVNNIIDAKLIATRRGFSTIHLLSELIITSGQSVDNLHFTSKNWIKITLEAGSSCVNVEFTKLSVYGVMSGLWNVMDDCWVFIITNFCGWMRHGTGFGDVSLAPYTIANTGASFFDDCMPMTPGDTSILRMNTNTRVSFINAHDLFQINDMTAGSSLTFGMLKATLTISASCTGGTITVGGIGRFYNNSVLIIDETGVLNQAVIADEVWGTTLSNTYTGSEAGALIEELHKLQGLKLGQPMTVTPSSRTAGSIDLAITGDGETSTTVTRNA